VTRQPVLLAWQMSNLFGWGVLGLNIFRRWAQDPAITPLSVVPADRADFAPIAPEEAPALEAAIAASNAIAARIAGGEGGLDMPVIHAMGNNLRPNFAVTGRRNIGKAVFENTAVPGARERLAQHDLLLCASNWNAGLLRGWSSAPVHMVFEGADQTVFHPAPRKGLLPRGRFTIFTGGKIEFRKGQDLVLLAFREFSRRHDDALLVTAWHSLWPEMSTGFRGRLAAPLALDAGGRLDLGRWTGENGIAPGKVIHLHRMGNHLLANYMREADCALQPSRAEASNNLMAMEAMACGLPVIIPRNSGMTDLIAGGNCLALDRQGPVTHPEGWGTEGWGESDVEEMVEALESLYAAREKREAIGAAAADFIGRHRSWDAHAAAVKALALS
jgi:glycosyltransferase involved in cell wall biosynthesis